MKARIKFTKSGSMKFVGHLDIMRYFQKVFRRSSIPVAYSQGFNPHQILSFASPLGVGLTSDGEYLDLSLLDSCDSSSQMLERMNHVMNDEIKVVSIKKLEDQSRPSMSIVAAADYLVLVKDGYQACQQLEDRFSAFMKEESIVVQKRTKKSVKEMDIKPYIYHVEFEKKAFEDKLGHEIEEEHAEHYENNHRIYVQLTAGSVINIKPELVLEAFCEYAGFPYNEFAYQVHRLELYADLNAEKGQVNANDSDLCRNLVPLDAIGEDFI